MLRDVDGEGEGGADNGNEREWMMEAEKLVDMFRETRNLFLTSRVSRLFNSFLFFKKGPEGNLLPGVLLPAQFLFQFAIFRDHRAYG